MESQVIEVGKSSNKENKVGDIEISPEVKPEERLGNDVGARVKDVELEAIEVGKPSNEEDNEVSPDAAVTASPEELKVDTTGFLREECEGDDGVASAENIELLATEADKLEESKSAEGKEVTLPEDKISDVHQKVEQVNKPQAELHPNFIRTNAPEMAPEGYCAIEGDKLSSEEKQLMEENKKLRDILEKFLEAGRNQLDVINGLNERVKGLEKRLEKKSKKRKVRVMKHKPVMAFPI